MILAILISLLSCGSEKKISITNSTHVKGYKAFNLLKDDTMNYLKENFVNNRQNYISKENRFLLNDLEIAVKSYAEGCAPINRYISPNMTILFNPLSSEFYKNDNGVKTYALTIYWQEPMQMSSIEQFIKENKSEWSEAHKNFFGNPIVKDIELVVSPDPNLPKK